MTTDHNEAMSQHARDSRELRELCKQRDAARETVRQQAERIAELEAERDATSAKLEDLQSTFDYVKERRAQISHRLWVWAHEELSEPLKTRYFNIVANGTADVMERPTYAQQYNYQKYRADKAEAERDTLRAELETERMRLVACGVVAMANTAESAAKARDMHPDYLCASVRDVAAAVDREMALRAEVERLRVDAERYEWLRDCHPADKSLWVAMGLPHAPGGVSCWRNDELDAAIDTARKATQ